MGLTSCGGDIDNVMSSELLKKQPGQSVFTEVTSLTDEGNPMSKLAEHAQRQDNKVLKTLEKRKCHFYYDLFTKNEDTEIRQYQITVLEKDHQGQQSSSQ